MAESPETATMDETIVDVEMLEDRMPDGQAPAVQGQQGGGQQGQRRLTAAEQAYVDRQKRLGQLIEAINKNRTQIEAFLKLLGIDFDFFKAAAIVGLKGTMKNDPDFFHKVHVSSFIDAVMRAAKDGLIPDGKQCAIARFANEAAYMPMVEGYIMIISASIPNLRDVNHNVIIEGDAFDYEEGSDPWVKHKPSLARDPQTGKAIGAWCLIRTYPDGAYLEVVGKADLERIARVNKSTKGPRNDWAGEMHRKAPFRRVLKRLPKSPRLSSLIAHEEMMILPAPTPESPREVRHAEARAITNDELFGGGRPRPTKTATPKKPAAAKAKGEGGRKRKASAQAGGAAVEETQQDQVIENGGDVADENAHQASPELMDLIAAILHAEAATDIAQMVQAARENEALSGTTADEWAWVDETARNAAEKLGAVGGEDEAQGLIAVLTSEHGPKSYDGTQADLWASDILNKLSSMKADNRRTKFWAVNLPHVQRAYDAGFTTHAGKILEVARSKGLSVEVAGG